MSNKKQSSIEWLVKQLKSQYGIDIERLSVTDKAKQMHKEEIIETYNYSADAGYNNDMIQGSEEYYNETFGGEE